MKLTVRGFEWRTGDKISPADFLHYLQEISTREYDDQIITVTPQGEWWAGLLLTDRPGRAFCKKIREGATFTVLPEQLEQGTNVVDFNFFLVNPATGRGLYQHYQHSPTPNQFCAFCQARFAELRRRRVEADVATLGPEPSRKAIALVEGRYLDRLGYTLLEQPGSFKEKVLALRKAKTLEYEVTSLEPTVPDVTPMPGSAKRVQVSVTFNPDYPARAILRNIAQSVSDGVFKKAKIQGIDAAGQEATYKLLNDVALFGEADHAQHAETVRIDSADLIRSVQDSPTVKLLRDIAERPEIRVLLNTLFSDG